MTGESTGTPLSPGQQQLWFLSQLHPGDTTYQILLAHRLRGPLRLDLLGNVITRVVERHEALRVTIQISDGVPFQVVTPPSDVHVDVADYTSLSPAAQQAAVDEDMRCLAHSPFDLERGPLYRYRVLKLADDDHVFIQNLHHIVSDGWSSGVMNAELAAAYEALLSGREPEFTHPAPGYTEWARAQHEGMTGAALEEELEFWATSLAGLPALEFPADRPRPPAPRLGAGTVLRNYRPELLEQARALSIRHQVPLFVVLTAVLTVVLSRYTGQDDFPVGIPMLNRLDEDTESTVGLFVNMVTLRANLSGDPEFLQLLDRILDTELDLYEHQGVPLYLIVGRMQLARSADRNPLFQVTVQLLGAANSGGSLSLPGITAQHLAFASPGARMDIAIDLIESGGNLRAVVEYSRDLFDEWRILALLGHIETVLSAAARDSSQRVSRLPILADSERRELLALGTGEHAEYSADPLHVTLAKIARAAPDSVAVVCRNAELTYAELDRRAGRLACHLRSLGLRHEQVVAVVLDRDLDAYVAMAGVLKAGGAFSMMDPKLPPARLDFMIRDTAAPVVITRSALVDRLPEPADWVAVALDTDWDMIEAIPAATPLPEWTTRESLAYVLYTSGSTGTPKGVMLPHRAVSFFCEAFRRSFDFGPHDRLLQLPALSFDMSQGEIWTAFLVGATVVAVSPEDAQSPEALAALMREQGVTYAGLPPAMQSVMEPVPYPALRYVMGGAEVLPPELVNKWNLPGRRYLNLYGPTECAVGQTEYEVDHIDWKTPPPIGRPMINRRVYIVDRWNNLVPKGVNGELLIGGASGGLARGYLNQPAMTAEKFIPDPFGYDGMVYRTGDLVRWNAAGQIEFIGRADSQVKLRGLRIELGEIETVLQSHPRVLRAVVLMRPDPAGENRLVGYYTSDGEPPQAAELRRHLGQALPDFMVPTAWVALHRFPMSNDGWKINRNALPEPPDAGASGPTTFASDTETKIAGCFQVVLSVSQVSPAASFFELGGNSLQAMRAVSRINKTFSIRITVRQLFGNPTAAALAVVVDELIQARSHD